MRLTNTIHQAIVSAIMDDVPIVDYDEMMQKELTAWAVSKMPPKVRSVWDDPALRHYIHLSQFARRVSSESGGDDRFVYGPYIPAPNDTHSQIPPALEHKLYEMDRKDKQQNEERRALRRKLEGVVNGCTTTQALAKQLPEFEKYIPQDEVATKNLPALANLVTDFVKAGWPKGGKTDVAATATN